MGYDIQHDFLWEFLERRKGTRIAGSSKYQDQHRISRKEMNVKEGSEREAERKRMCMGILTIVLRAICT